MYAVGQHRHALCRGRKRVRSLVHVGLVADDSHTYRTHGLHKAPVNSTPSASASSSPIKPVTDTRDRDSIASTSANVSASTRQSLGSDGGVSIGKEALFDRLKLVQAERERLLKKASERLARRKAEQEQEGLEI